MNTKAKLKPLAILVCKDIVPQDDGTETLNGMLTSGSFLYYGESRTQTIAVSVLFKVLENGVGGFEMKVSGDPLERDVLMVVSDQYWEKRLTEHEYASATAGGIALKIVTTGQITFSWRPLEGEWDVIRTLRVKDGTSKPQYIAGNIASGSAAGSSTATMSAPTVSKERA